jgi:hypothetical protein
MIRENLAKKFKGIDEIGTRHLFGQVYDKVPGDIKAGGIEVIIRDEENEIVASTVTDIEGNFAMHNLHPGQDYYFKFKNSVPGARIYVVNNKNKVLYVMEKNKDNKYLFDRSAYENAHLALSQANE